MPLSPYAGIQQAILEAISSAKGSLHEVDRPLLDDPEVKPIMAGFVKTRIRLF